MEAPWHRYKVAQALLRLSPEERKLLRGLTNYLDIMQAIHDMKQKQIEALDADALNAQELERRVVKSTAA